TWGREAYATPEAVSRRTEGSPEAVAPPLPRPPEPVRGPRGGAAAAATSRKGRLRAPRCAGSPLRTEPARRPAIPGTPLGMTAGALTARSKVLVADDAEVDRSTAQATLAAAGYEVVEAVDGQHALEVFARERPELVLLDVVMPRLTGVEVCRILKAKTPTTYLPVILVSQRNSVNER